MSTDKQMKELMVLADIREVLGVGHKPMLSELVEMVHELRKDKARLDWLQALPMVVLSRTAMRGTNEVDGYGSDGYDFCCEKNTIREAIDAAMKEEVES